MATYYAREFIGTSVDGTQNPPKMANAAAVDGKVRSIDATKNPAGGTQALAAADKLYLGRLPAGAIATGFFGITDTTLGTSTISIGTLAAPTKYVNAQTLTTVNQKVSLGINAAARDDGPLAAPEDLYATIGTATVAAATVLVLETEYKATA